MKITKLVSMNKTYSKVIWNIYFEKFVVLGFKIRKRNDSN